MKTNSKVILLCLPLFLSSCSLSAKKSYPVSDYRSTLPFKDNFKIMQLTDLHFSVQSDYKRVTNYLSLNIRSCNPDLIILTGDTFMDSSKNIVDNVINFIDSFNIPFAFTYGNHDKQGMYGADYINLYLSKTRNSLLRDYSDDVLFGDANYFIDLMEGKNTKYRLYIIDSNTYHYNGIDFDYDVIHDDQIAHLEEIEQSEGKVPSLAFYHIPLYEADDAYLEVEAGKITEYKGKNFEKRAVGYKRTDAFTRMKNIGVIGHFYGHDHINYTDIMYEGVTLSYGVKSTPEIYNSEDLLGYKTITLKNDMNYDLTNIESVVVPYE